MTKIPSTLNLMDKIVSLCKRRGFIFPGSEIYGGLQNSWDYGPLGVELKNNIKHLWWKRFVHERGDVVGIDAALIMNPKVWEASGHTKHFNDPLIECRKCHSRFREDELRVLRQAQDIKKDSCPHCDGALTEVKQFNMMFQTTLGPSYDSEYKVYLRPETAQAMFVDFKNVMDTMRLKLPFGIAQIGKAFRNEITPGNFIFRTREFEQMEIEYFVRPKEWEKAFESWKSEIKKWLKDIGVNFKNIHELEVAEGDRAHYSKRTIDFEYDFPFGRKELYGLAYRTDFDLKNHEEKSGQNLKYRDEEIGDEYHPHVIEPTWGVDRSVLVVLLESYYEDENRIVLKLKPELAPYKAAVFPLLSNKPELIKLAREVYNNLKKMGFSTAWDDRGNIGKRYYSQDEIGTPYCITVDFESLENGDVTVRNRDTTKQKRVKVSSIDKFLKNSIM